MRRDILNNAADGRKKPVCYITTSIIAAIGVIMSITACGRQENTENVSAGTGTEAPAVIEDETGTSSAIEDSAASTPIYASISEEIQANLGGEPLDIKLTEAIEENVVLSDDTEIEACEWVDEAKSCLRVRVQYKEWPPDNYQHKEDYFFFQEGESIQALYVDYPTKDWENMEKDRYVWDACDFVAHLEDVTFDGRDDLIIFLGHLGNRGEMIHGAYVFEDGFYHYKPGFEDIPNYEVDLESQAIRGWQLDGPITEWEFVFKYQNGDFEMLSYESHELFEGYDIFPSAQRRLPDYAACVEVGKSWRPPV